jgi:2-hydroxymuconate-semialdehyde hydrolase
MIKTLTVRGRQIRVCDTGDPADPPILLLHGIGRSLEDWAEQHELLSDSYRVISVDLPGFGLSGRLPGPVTLESFAAGVLETLDVLGETRPVHLMGNSLGGAVAMHLLVLAPSRVRTMTLAAPAGFGREVIINLRALAIPGLGKRLLRGLTRSRTARRIEATLFHDRALVTPERVDFAMRAAAQPDFIPVYAEIARALGTFRGVSPAWRRALLAAVASVPRPTLLIWGSRDRILPSSQLAAARVAFPTASWHMFDDTGHMPQIERPREFADLVRPFLQAHSPSSAAG